MTNIAAASISGRIRVFSALVTLIWMCLLPTSLSAAEKGCEKPADCLAQELIATIPGGEKIAIRPFLPRETGIPPETGKRLYDDILKSLFTASGGLHQIIGRDRMQRIWKIWEEQFTGDFAQFLEQNRATVEIVCNVASHSTGFELSCVATPIGKDRAVAAQAIAQQVFPLEQERFHLDHGMADIAKRLADSAKSTNRAGRAIIINNNTGQQSELTNLIGGRVMAAFNKQQAEIRAICERDKLGREVLQSGGGPQCGAANSYVLRGNLWWTDKNTADLNLSLTAGAGNLADEWVKIDRKSLPATLTARDGENQSFYRAVAGAIISPNLDRPSAERAARNLARGRVVAQALGIRAPGVTDVMSEADGVLTMGKILNEGIPIEERFTTARVDGNRLEVELQARVRKVGSTIRPALKARLESSVVRAYAPLKIQIDAEETLHLAIYSWGADNRVVRLYPGGNVSELTIRSGERVYLPRAGENRILSAPLPLPGNVADHEAIIVVASAKPKNFEKLAPLAGGSLAATANVAVTGGVFFDRLVRLDISRLSVSFLPYQVSKDERRAR